MKAQVGLGQSMVVDILMLMTLHVLGVLDCIAAASAGYFLFHLYVLVSVLFA